MATIVLHYAVNPLLGIWTKLDTFFQIVGYSRACGELRRLGYNAEADYCLKQIKELRSK